MAKDAVKMQKACGQCHELVDVEESLFIQEARNWWHRTDFSLHRMLPSDRFNAIKNKKIVKILC